MPKRVLILNGSNYEVNLIHILKEFGYYVITSGNVPLFEGHKLADKYIMHDFSDKEGMLRIAEKENIDYICACSNDFGVLTAAYIAEMLGLPGHDTYQNAKIIAEKDLFKNFAQKNNIQVIPSIGFSDVEKAIEYTKKAQLPIIVKPVDLTGGKGVTKVFERKKAEDATRHAFQRSRAKRIVIEPYIMGSQHSITAFLVNQKVAAYGTYNEYSANDEFLVGSTSCPADDEAFTKGILIDQIEKIASLLRLNDGIFHVQYRMNGTTPLIMECMRRILGNHALECLTLSTGIDWERIQAKCYCSMDYLTELQFSNKCCECTELYVQAPANGRVSDISIDDKLKPYIVKEYWQWHQGQLIDHYLSEKLGFLFLRFPDRVVRDRVNQHLSECVRVIMG